MLVLSRKPGEYLTIGDDIVLTVVEVRGNRVKIGIAAPRDTQVRRGELPPYEHKKPSGSEGESDGTEG